jgi:hypothetical protein
LKLTAFWPPPTNAAPSENSASEPYHNTDASLNKYLQLSCIFPRGALMRWARLSTSTLLRRCCRIPKYQVQHCGTKRHDTAMMGWTADKWAARSDAPGWMHLQSIQSTYQYCRYMAPRTSVNVPGCKQGGRLYLSTGHTSELGERRQLKTKTFRQIESSLITQNLESHSVN